MATAIMIGKHGPVQIDVEGGLPFDEAVSRALAVHSAKRVKHITVEIDRGTYALYLNKRNRAVLRCDRVARKDFTVVQYLFE